jgi:Uma2 family endonuclease
MATRERIYTVDDVWRLTCAPENDAKKICLINGELLITMSPSRLHGRLALRIGRFIADYADKHSLGEAAVEVGYYPPNDIRTLLIPDVAFEGKARAEQPLDAGYAPFMPDLAVEIISPSQSLAQARRKAKVYLRHGAALVWLVDPAEKSAEAWAAGNEGEPQSEAIGIDDELSGRAVLPGFRLPLRHLFPE